MKHLFSVLTLTVALFLTGATISTVTAAPTEEAAPAFAPSPVVRAASSFNVGQVYVGGHLGMAVPLSLGRDDDEISFHDVAKTGFVIYADGMYQMSQAIGVGAELGFRTYPYSDERTWSNLTRYGTFEAKYTAFDFALNGRLFLGRKTIRPFLGVAAGGELIMNSIDFVPNSLSSSTHATNYDSHFVSACFGFMGGAYFKAGKRTLVSLQVRLNLVPNLKDELIEMTGAQGDIQTVQRNPHGNQNNLMVTIGLHVGTQKNNKH